MKNSNNNHDFSRAASPQDPLNPRQNKKKKRQPRPPERQVWQMSAQELAAMNPAQPEVRARPPRHYTGSERIDWMTNRRRRARYMTQQQLADVIGSTQNTISRLERGETAPSLNTVFKIADALGVSVIIERNR